MRFWLEFNETSWYYLVSPVYCHSSYNYAITPTLNELSAPRHSASQVMRLSLSPSSCFLQKYIVPSIYTVKRRLCLIWSCYLYSLWLYKPQHVNRKMFALFCHSFGLVCQLQPFTSLDASPNSAQYDEVRLTIYIQSLC